MSVLEITRAILDDLRARGVKEFGIIQLHEEVQRRLGKWVYQDTVRKYADFLLAGEFPTEIPKHGRRAFILKPRQALMF